MKILKVMLKKVRTAEQTGITYPDAWVSTEINVLAYEGDPNAMGEVEEYCIALTPNTELETELLKDDAVTEINIETANKLGDECLPQRLIVDDKKLPDILVAMDKDKAERTQDEIDMLDPDNETEGIRRTAKFDVSNWMSE